MTTPHAHRAATGACLLVLALALAGCTGTAGSGAAPTAATPTSSAPAASPTPDSATATVSGLPTLPDFPVEIMPEAGWLPGESDPGAIYFSLPDGVSGIAVHAVRTLAGTPQRDVPEDVAGFLLERRADLVVTDPKAVTHSGLPAQRFRLAMREGHTPSDLWTVADGTAFKPLDRAPMEVLAVRSSEGLVLVWTEWEPADEQAALAAFDSALEKVRVS
jgi:hypothetical protein